jgi:hypothetical protein
LCNPSSNFPPDRYYAAADRLLQRGTFKRLEGQTSGSNPSKKHEGYFLLLRYVTFGVDITRADPAPSQAKTNLVTQLGNVMGMLETDKAAIKHEHVQRLQERRMRQLERDQELEAAAKVAAAAAAAAPPPQPEPEPLPELPPRFDKLRSLVGDDDLPVEPEGPAPAPPPRDSLYAPLSLDDPSAGTPRGAPHAHATLSA